MIKRVSLISPNQETKERQRQIEKDVQAFKKAGGKVQVIPAGLSANPSTSVFKAPQDCSTISYE